MKGLPHQSQHKGHGATSVSCQVISLLHTVLKIGTSHLKYFLQILGYDSSSKLLVYNELARCVQLQQEMSPYILLQFLIVNSLASTINKLMTLKQNVRLNYEQLFEILSIPEYFI